MTDRPEPTTSQVTQEIPLPSTPKKSETIEIITPEHVRPYPKTLPRKNKNTRKKIKSRVLTETPEKNKIEKETLEREERKNK